MAKPLAAGSAWAIRQRVAEPAVGGLTILGRIRHVLLPAALPCYLAGLKQGWAFSWRSLMAAELITYSPALGIGLGQQLNIGRELNAMDLVIASITLILVVGIAIELLIFAPVEGRVLHARTHRGPEPLTPAPESQALRASPAPRVNTGG
ncbi:MAG: ABC transporter permease [Pseudonocardiaceae bacterium]